MKQALLEIQNGSFWNGKFYGNSIYTQAKGKKSIKFEIENKEDFQAAVNALKEPKSEMSYGEIYNRFGFDIAEEG